MVNCNEIVGEIRLKDLVFGTITALTTVSLTKIRMRTIKTLIYSIFILNYQDIIIGNHLPFSLDSSKSIKTIFSK